MDKPERLTNLNRMKDIRGVWSEEGKGEDFLQGYLEASIECKGLVNNMLTNRRHKVRTAISVIEEYGKEEEAIYKELKLIETTIQLIIKEILLEV